MTITYNSIKQEYEVSLTSSDLEIAFKSEQDFRLLLHTVVEQSYGQELADKLFPIK